MESYHEYRHPFADNTLTIALSDPSVHHKYWSNAVDFLLCYGVEILAARGGKVVEVKDDSTEGGLEERFKDNKYLNFITIEHKNGEHSQYCHLAHGSALVKKSDVVKEGQPIASGIGMTGYTSAPHLHFMVFRNIPNEKGFESLEIRWKTPLNVYKSGQEAAEELQKPEYKPLLDCAVKAQKPIKPCEF